MVTFTGFRGSPRNALTPLSSLRVTLAGAEEWEENSVGWSEKVVVGEGNHKLAWRQLIKSVAFADAQTPHFTKKKN